MSRRLVIDFNKINKGKTPEDLKILITRILTVVSALIAIIYIAIPIITTLDLLHYLRTPDFPIAVISLVMIWSFYNMFINRKRGPHKPHVTYKKQPKQNMPPNKIQIIECDLCGRSKLPDEIVEISNGVFVCKTCIEKALLGGKH